MATYVIAIRREARADTTTAEEWVCRQQVDEHSPGAAEQARQPSADQIGRTSDA